MSGSLATQEQQKRGIVPTAKVGARGVEIENLETLWWMANRVIESGLAPKDCKSAADAVIRAQMGMELGLSFMYSVQNIANINGRPAIWGDAIPALVLASPVCEIFIGQFVGKDDGTYTDSFGYEVTAKRRGQPETKVRFCVGDAKKAGLWGKNTWAPYPKDMLRHKAVARAAKSVFADVLGGISVREDLDVIEVQAEPILPRNNVEELADALESENEVMPAGGELFADETTRHAAD